MAENSGCPKCALLVAVVATLNSTLSCSPADERAPFIAECINDPLCSSDAGRVDRSGGGSGSEPLECFSTMELERRSELYNLTPMTGTPNRFRDDAFHFMVTDPLLAPAKILTLAAGGGGLACAEWDTEVPFTLFAADPEFGSVLIEPLAEGAFVPTVLQAVAVMGNSPYLPVFPRAEIDKIFEDIGIERNPERSQILTMIVAGTDDAGRPIPQPGVAVESSFAEAVAFKVGSTWTTDRDDTAIDGAGLALLVNVNAYPTVEGTASVSFEGEVQSEWDLISSEGAVTYALILAGSNPN